MKQAGSTIVILTAGAGGMYCGACLNDNVLASELTRQGVDVQLIPTYTPIRTDESDVSVDRVLMGGISVYLQQMIPLLRYTPAFLDHWLDNPRLIRWVTSGRMTTSARKLGPLTVSMLRGESGNQRKEIHKLCSWLKDRVNPALINLSNILIGGCLPALKRELDVPVIVTLQGDDVFLDDLPDPYREQALAEIRKLDPFVDGYLVHSQFYADHMADRLGVDRQKFSLVRLGIHVADFSNDTTQTRRDGPPVVGYLARLAPEKGLDLLCEAFVQLRNEPATRDTQMLIAGWLGRQHEEYAEGCFARLRAAGLEDAFRYVGELDRVGKRDFLRQIDVLSVPSPYPEPKGIYVLEALASGVPVVQPAHGTFPELLDNTGGGLLFPPGDTSAICAALTKLIADEDMRIRLGRQGQDAVVAGYTAESMASAVRDVYQSFIHREAVQRPSLRA